MGDAKKRPVSMVPLGEFQDADFTLDKSKIKLMQELGKGAFSTVYKALYDGMPMAIKKQKIADADLERYIRKELSILRRCNHRGLVMYIGACRADAETIYIATEYCPGGDLRRLLQSKSPLGWKLRARIAQGTAEAITYLHERELIHRDIKTENILLSGELSPKLCDFGFARNTTKAPGARPMTMCGTDEFMAPEVIFGMPYDNKADIFGFGIVLAEIITRKIPGRSDKFLDRQPIHGFTVDKAELKAACDAVSPPESFFLLCNECVADEATDRPSAEECFNWLDDLLHDLPPDREPVPAVDEAAFLQRVKSDLDEQAIEEASPDLDDETRLVLSKDDPRQAAEDKAKRDRIRRATFKARAEFTKVRAGGLADGVEPKPPQKVPQQQALSTDSSSAAGARAAAVSRAAAAPALAPKAPATSAPPPVPPASPVASESLPQMSGYVTKRGGRIKTWRRRFMVLTAEGLVYFKSKEDFMKAVDDEVQGSLLFEEMLQSSANTVCDTVQYISTGKHNSFRIMTNSRARFFHTSDSSMTKRWVRNINLAYSQWLLENKPCTSRAGAR